MRVQIPRTRLKQIELALTAQRPRVSAEVHRLSDPCRSAVTDVCGELHAVGVLRVFFVQFWVLWCCNMVHFIGLEHGRQVGLNKRIGILLGQLQIMNIFYPSALRSDH